jgi:hypothetical protein
MRAKEEWIAGLKKMRRNVYLAGEKKDGQGNCGDQGPVDCEPVINLLLTK